MDKKEKISHFVECVINGDGAAAAKELKTILKENIDKTINDRRINASSIIEDDLNKKGIKKI